MAAPHSLDEHPSDDIQPAPPRAAFVRARPAPAEALPLPPDCASSPMAPQALPLNVAAPPMSAAAPLFDARNRLIIGGTAALALLFCLGLVLTAVLWVGRSRIASIETVSILSNLQVVQRTWWDVEGLAAGTSDPEGAFERLQDKQRGWWENEELAKDGDSTGHAALARLDDLQRRWYASEGLDRGGPCKDPAGALSRLQSITQQWWKDENPGKIKADAGPESDPSPPTAAELADLKVKLVDKDGTRRFRETGGTLESEEAVQLGLQWLAAQQRIDGSWAPDGNRGGRAANNVTTTALALLPFLARGETHKGSQDVHRYTKQVELGIQYLIDHQLPTGDLRGGTTMYTHALAAIALCEALSMTSDPLLRGPAQRAVDFLIKAQARDGGWRYTPAPPRADLSVTSWCLMALKSGQMAGIIIPRETLDRATVFLQGVSRSDGGYGYQPGSAGHSPPLPAVMTAAGLVCRHYLANESGHRDDERFAGMSRGVDIILKNLPRKPIKNYYYWYYATYALLPIGGDAWKHWNPQVRDLIVSLQDKGTANAALKGSWDVNGAIALAPAGRVGVTALALLTLEVYYRHLPLNRPELGEMAKDLSKTTK